MIVRRVRADELRRCSEVMSLAFEFPCREERTAEEIAKEVLENPKGRFQRYYDHKWAAFEDDDKTMMGFICTIPYVVGFDGHTCKMNGIGGVSTLPHYRRTGSIRGCFEKSLPWMYEEGYAFSYLYPFSSEFYRKFGYELCGEQIAYEVNLQAYKRFAVGGKCVLAEGSACFEDIKKVYCDFARGMNMMCVREDEDYPFARDLNPAKDCVYTYVYYNDAGEAKGVMTFDKTRENGSFYAKMNCKQFLFSDMEGIKGLLNHALSYIAYYSHICFRLPVHMDVLSLIPEWPKLPYARTIAHVGMNRVVNAQKVLEMAKYRGSGKVTMKIKDDQIVQNNGLFTVVFENGKTLSVEKGGEAADIELTIADFSRLITGSHDLSQAMWFAGTEILNPENEALNGVFYRKPIFIIDSF